MTRTTYLTGLLFLLVSFLAPALRAQSVGVNTTTPDASAALDVSSTTQGMLVPRLTTAQRTAVSSPATGLLVFDSTTGSFWFYSGAAWTEITVGTTSPWSTLGSDIYKTNSGGVGIGTSDPTALLHVSDGNFLTTGTFGSGPSLSSSGAGTRMLFYPQKAAFRAGHVNSTEWNDANIGDYSIAAGYTSKASSSGTVALGNNAEATAENAVALGYFSRASGSKSFAVGEYATASGTNSTAFGYFSVASGERSFTVGENTIASGRNSTALGYFTIASGEKSFALGENTMASGKNAMALGSFTIASGDNTFAANRSTIAPSFGETVFGQYNTTYAAVSPTSWNTADRLFSIGNGTTGSNTSDALVVLKSGNIGIGSSTPTNKLEVNGTTKTTSLQITNGANNGYVLQSDASGISSWVNPTTLSNGNWTTSGSNQYSALSGNIGIGTTSPTNKLDIQSSSSITANVQSSGSNAYIKTAAPSGSEDGLLFSTYASGSTSTRWLFGKSNGSESGSNAGSDFFINRYSDAGAFLSQPFRIARSTGYVGIGGASASTALEVNGTTKTTNFQMTSGATNGYLLQSDASGNGAWVNQSVLAPTSIRDTDADTKIQVEETADEDKIHFDMNGTEYLVLDAGRIYTKNTGLSVFIGENAGAADDLVDNQNVGIGYGAMDVNTSGAGNVAIGKDAMGANTSGALNVAVGRNALSKNTSGVFNTAIGPDVMLDNTTGYFNTALGYGALADNQDGIINVALGANALHSIISGDRNVAIGVEAGYNATGSDNVFIGNETAYDETGSNKLYIDNSNTTSPLIWGDFSSNYVNINGNLGIGTTTPTQAKLVINGSASTNIGNYGYLNSAGNNGTGSGTNAYSLYASARVAATEFNAFSDARIKNIQGLSDSRADLNTLLSIEITDYKLKDYIDKGNKFYKKVIAQQVEKVYPQAVSTITDVVPDIYQLAEIKDGYIALTNTLKAGDKVKLIFGERTEVVVISAANASGFKVNLPDQGKVFVYGREVSDFHTVDYEALSMLNISATHELVKMINNQSEAISALQTDNQAMKSDIKIIKAALQHNAIITEK